MINKSANKPFKKRDEATEITISELRDMRVTFLIANCVLWTVSMLYLLIAREGGWQLFSGIVFGNAAVITNFYMLGVSAGKALQSKNAKTARRKSRTSYILRYFGGFIIFGVFIHFNLINAITAVVPLFYVKIYYVLSSIRNS